MPLDPARPRGFFYEAWANGGADWTRIEVPAAQIPRITPEFLAEERRHLGSNSYYRQEYECSFEALEGLVYPDFAKCIVPSPLSPPGRGAGGEGHVRSAQVSERSASVSEDACSAPAARSARVSDPAETPDRRSPQAPSPIVSAIPAGKKLGGMDFGYRNPFAAVWGVLDRDDVLWLTGEHYCRQQPLSYHATHLPRDVYWYADPSGAGDISELRCAGFVMRKGDNNLRTGISAVHARLADGRLCILPNACPNLLAEAALYRYDSDAESRRTEASIDDHNHALDALRYLVSRLDARKMARLRRKNPSAPEQPANQQQKPKRPWLSIYNEALWTRLFP